MTKKTPGDTPRPSQSSSSEIKHLIDEVRELREQLELLKLGPAISEAVKKTARDKSGTADYTVTYNVYSKSYSVIV